MYELLSWSQLDLFELVVLQPRSTDRGCRFCSNAEIGKCPVCGKCRPCCRCAVSNRYEASER